MFRRPPGGYDSDEVFAFGIGHVKNVGGNHTYDHKTFFAIVLPVVQKLDGKGVSKDLFSQLKTDSVAAVIVLCLGLVPWNFKVI